MSKSSDKQRFDEDILQSKAEILRLKGIAPPFGQPPKRDSAPLAEKPQKPVSASEISSSAIAKNLTGQAHPYIPDAAFSDTAAFSAPRIEAMRQNEFISPPEQSKETAIAENEIVRPQGDNGDEFDTAAKDAESVEAESELSNDSEIPGFDLAQQIMAAQRKISGNRRKGPGSPRFPIKEEKPKPQAVFHHSHKSSMNSAPMSPQQRIIAEIVAKDINKFYQGSKIHK